MISAARPWGAASASTRAFALVLAALATGIPLFLLILGLSIRTIDAMRDPPLSFELIPEPPPPPPEPQPPRPSPAKPAERAAAPAPAAPRPATLVDQTVTPVPPPMPQPVAADFSGSGNATTPGVGSGGDGPGGNGSGPRGGTARPVAPAARPVRTAASWIYKPGSEELRPYNPPMASADNVTGEVLLSCRVLRNRRVEDCRVVADRPRGYGFGRAALEVAHLFRLRPPTVDGEPDEAQRVEIPVTFNSRP